MQCPYCESTQIRKNGKRRGKQNHICVNCDRQFIDVHDPPKGYSEELSQKQQLQMRDSWAAIAAAIERRGMSDRYQVKFHRGKYAIARK